MSTQAGLLPATIRFSMPPTFSQFLSQFPLARQLIGHVIQAQFVQFGPGREAAFGTPPPAVVVAIHHLAVEIGIEPLRLVRIHGRLLLKVAADTGILETGSALPDVQRPHEVVAAFRGLVHVVKRPMGALTTALNSRSSAV